MGDKHLAVSPDTKDRFETFKRRLGVARDRDETHDSTIKWLLENAPAPEDAEGDT